MSLAARSLRTLRNVAPFRATYAATQMQSRSFVGLGTKDKKQACEKNRGFGAFVQQEASSDADPTVRQELNAATANESSTQDSTSAASPPKKDPVDPAEKWKEITVDMWRDAVYTNETYFGELIADTAEFLKTIAEHIKLNGKRVSLVEVGCGTGEFTRQAADDFRTVVGIDFNKEFIEYCDEHTREKDRDKMNFIQGDATELYKLLKDRFPKKSRRGMRGVEFWDDCRVVACVGNTIGIIPEELRPAVYDQMAEVAGADGVIVMVYWNAKWFGDACLNFYHANPKLCGPFEGESVDFKNTTLTTPMQYKTKWTSVDEAREIMDDLGMEIIALREKGKGVFVAARRF